MNIYSFTALSASIASVLLAFYVYRKNIWGLRNILFALICLIEAYWLFVDFQIQSENNYERAFFWFRAGALWPFSFTLLYHFTLAYSGKIKSIGHNLSLALSYGFTALVVFYRFFSTRTLEDIERVSWGWRYVINEESLLAILVLIWMCLTTCYSLYLAFNSFLSSKNNQVKNQSKYLIIGYTIPIISALIFEILIPALKLNIPSFGNITYIIGNAIIFYGVFSSDIFVIDSLSIYKNIINTMTDSFILIDKSFKIFMCNPSATILTGYSLAELKEMNFFQLLHKTSVAEEKVGNIFSLEREYSIDITIHTKNKRNIPVSLSSSILKNRLGNRVIGAVIIIHNISDKIKLLEEKEKLQEEILQIQKLEAIGQLAGGIAHDFKNALGTILLAADDMKDHSNAENEDFKASIEDIIEAAEYATDLTKKILVFARKENIEMDEVNIHLVVENIIKIIEHTFDKNILVEYDLHALDALIFGNATQLQTVLLNMVLNARDAMHSGGRLKINTKNVSIPGEKIIHSYELPEGNYIRIEIIDSGTGMDIRTQERIFEPFFTTKPVGKGTGLGLASAYGIVKNHQGFIFVESMVEAGTKFTIYFPLLEIVKKWQ